MGPIGALPTFGEEMTFKNLDALCSYMNELYEKQQWNFLDSDIQAELDSLTENAPVFGGPQPSCTLEIISWDSDRLLVIDNRGYAICTREDWGLV